MKNEILAQGMTAADLEKLDLVADVQFFEPMGSAALNRKFYGIMPHGIYRGFQAVARGGLKVSVGDSPVNVAAVDVDGFMITVQGRRPVELTVPVGRKVYGIIEANYAVGRKTTQVDINASIKAADIRIINPEEKRGNHVIIFSANLPAGTTEIRADQIDLSERQEADIGSDAMERHTKDYLNPHQVNKGQIGLGDVENYGVATVEEAKAGTATHKYMTPATTAAAITQQAGAAVSSHTGNKNNPHAVTKAQVGLGKVQDYAIASQADAQAGSATDKYMTPATTKAAITAQAGAAVSSHTGDKGNPHGVTKAQVGLGNADNTSDVNKPVSTATRTELDKKVNKAGDTMTGRLKVELPSKDLWPNNTVNDKDNYIQQSAHSVVVGNNGLHVFGHGGFNARRMGIQSAHSDTGYATSYGTLDLNPYGGAVRVNGHAVYSRGDKPTKADVGLGSVQDYGVASTAEAQAGTVTNKYMTPALTKAAITEQAGAAVSSHTGNKNNPHAVTKAQVGLGSVNNWGATSATNDASDTKYATASAVKKTYDLAETKLASNVREVVAQDWNTLTTAGSYTVSAMTGANKPTINGAPPVYEYGTLFVQNTGKEICQIYIADNNRMYIRDKYFNNSWGTWSAVSCDESVVINKSVDLNDYTMGGTFNLYKGEGVTFTNAPSGLSFGTLQVIGRGQTSASFVTQILTWKDDGRQMIRTRNDGSFNWTPWRKIYSEAQKPTKADVGLGSVQDYGVASTAEAQAGTAANKYMTPALTKAAITEQAGAAVSSHTGNKNNPHAVTKAQVGLGNADNTSDANKPVSTATRTELDKKANKAGDTFTGQMSFTSNYPHTSANAQIFHNCAGANGSIQNIRSMRESGAATWLWEKVSNGSLYYSTGTNGAGTNKIRFAVSVGEIYLGDANKRVYHEGFKPTKADVGLGSVNDWGATSATNDASDTKYATAGAVKKAYDLANGKAPASHNHAWGNITGVPVYATRWPTAAEAGAAPASHTHSYLPLSGGTLSNSARINHGNTCMWELHVPGKWAVATVLNGSNGNFEFWATNGGGGWSKTYAYFNQSSGEFYSGYNGNFNDVYIRSDRRLKTNLVKAENALSKVSKINAYHYDKRLSLEATEYTEKEFGLIAQELEAVLPEAVKTDEQTTLKTISNSAVNALLVEAIKELKSEVEALKAKLSQVGA